MKTALFVISCCGMTCLCQADALKPMDSKVMLRAYCLGGSRVDKQALGGYGTSDNHPKKLGDRVLGRDGQLALVALPGEAAPFDQAHAGFRLLLINRTKLEVALSASDSRLSIIQEARDGKGRWRPIEYLPDSWCGNSFHRVYLPAKHYWEFRAPQYVGSRRTKLRFVLLGASPLYSNEFDGSINPQQFTNKQVHTPTSIMDPYRK